MTGAKNLYTLALRTALAVKRDVVHIFTTGKIKNRPWMATVKKWTRNDIRRR